MTNSARSLGVLLSALAGLSATHAASYDPATGLLSVPSLAISGSTACYQASLRTLGSNPLILEVQSAQARDCNGQESATYSAGDGRLSLQAVSLPTGACFDVTLLRVSSTPLQFQLAGAFGSACTVAGVARPGQP